MYSDDRNSRILETKTVGNSGVHYTVLEYNTPDGKLRQLRIELKDVGGVVLESGTLLSAEKTVKLGKNDKVRMPGGNQLIPDNLEGYFKPNLTGGGSILLNPTKNIISILPVEKNMGLIIEKGKFLACDAQFSTMQGQGGFEVETSWNRALRSGVRSYRDMTTTSIKGRGVLVLELEQPLVSLTQYDINSPIRINEDAIVMRTHGIERRSLSDEEKEFFTGYSGVEGKGVLYGGSGRMWVYPGNTLPTSTDNLGIIRSFNEKDKDKDEDLEEEKERKKRRFSILDTRR